jgi:multiple sugar transport system substrate-binding protein
MSPSGVLLQGITWNHTRGYLPMVATAQRFGELQPEVEIHWDKRSLQQFADWPIERLAEKYDLLVIDHPFVGHAAAHDVLLPLDHYLPRAFLDDQAANSVGASHPSYIFGGHQWALSIDAATPVSGYRRDLLERAGMSAPPRTWDELLEAARRGLVAIPAIGIDSLMNFYMLVLALEGGLFERDDRVVTDEATGVRALEMLKQLADLCGPESLSSNPIAVWNRLAESDTVALCPFAYGYSNYARPGYASHTLEFGGLPHTDSGQPLRSVLGGAGLAISSRATGAARQAALEYCAYVAGADCQRTLYFESGGQPGHRAAWTSDQVNRRCGAYFRNTLPTLDQAWLRPRYDGYLHFQDHAGPVVHAFLRAEQTAVQAISQLNTLYRQGASSH